jgi:DNA-binding protein YbaB
MEREPKPLARRRQREQRITVAQDDWGLVEVGVTRTGEIVEVAINTALVGKVEPADLAEAMLQAARAAQHRATHLHSV